MGIWLSVGPFAWWTWGPEFSHHCCRGKKLSKEKILYINRQQKQEYLSRSLQREGCEKEAVRGSSMRKKVPNRGGGRTLHGMEGCCHHRGLLAPCEGPREHQEASKASMFYASFCENTAWHLSSRDIYLSVKQFPALTPAQQESISVSSAHHSLVWHYNEGFLAGQKMPHLSVQCHGCQGAQPPGTPISGEGIADL